MASLRIFGFSIVVTIVSLIVGFIYGQWEALALLLILGILEISLSFDNAVINATVLQRMSMFWQRIFLTVGVLIAVFGMRLVFPLLIVYFASGLGPIEALNLALNPPPDGAPYFDGDPSRPSYETLITEAHPQIAAFGGVFLLMLFLDFIFEDRDIKWLHWIEEPLAKIGRLDQLSVVVALLALVVAATQLAEPEKLSTVLLSGALGLLAYLVVNGLGNLFHVPGEGDDEDGDEAPHLEERSKRLAGTPQAEDVLSKQEAKAERSGPSDLALATGKAGFFLFLYLEVLDATFSFDGVIGAFAITSDPIIIALGLGFIGAMFVRSITIFLVRKGTLNEYVYLEHGAHWAIGALAVILIISVGTIHISEVITGLVGVVLIGLAYLSSVLRNRREAAEQGEPESESDEVNA
ncbi:MAG: DUF475 domain-containing protein [Mycobacterium sp.]